MPGGRPSSYTAALGERICQRIAEGETMRSIIASDTSLSNGSIYRWAEEHAEFREKLARARVYQGDSFHDEAVDRARRATSKNAQAARVAVDTLLKVAGMAAPKKYGARVQVEDVTPPENRAAQFSADERDALQRIARDRMLREGGS